MFRKRPIRIHTKLIKVATLERTLDPKRGGNKENYHTRIFFQG